MFISPFLTLKKIKILVYNCNFKRKFENIKLRRDSRVAVD